MKLAKWQWRLLWLGGLGLLWLLCSGVALAIPLPLLDRIASYPNWQGKPPVQAVQSDDLVYPDWFAGDWTVTTTLVDLIAPLAPDLVTPGFESNRQFLDQPITFQVRFRETQPSRFNHAAKQLVSDRAYNGTQLAKAYLGDRAVLAVKVDPKNPNRQITLLKGDRQLVSTVTARATEAPNPSEFVTSEFFQQEFRGTPQLYFNEVENTTVYHWNSDASPTNQLDQITADQITAIYLSPQDADYFKTVTGPLTGALSEPRPVALYRYRMAFVRTAGD
jgi:hypothetical protein